MSTINRCFKARCPDQISGRLLKFTAASIDTAVTKRFNQSTSNFCNSFVSCTIRNWNTFSSHVLLACFLNHYLKLIFAHTCKISHYSDIVCHLHLLHKFL